MSQEEVPIWELVDLRPGQERVDRHCRRIFFVEKFSFDWKCRIRLICRGHGCRCGR